MKESAENDAELKQQAVIELLIESNWLDLLMENTKWSVPQ